MKMNTSAMEWTRAPKAYRITPDCVELTTEPHTDLWQRTYYHFRNDNAPALQLRTEEPFFSFTVKTEFDSKVRFDQSGVILYLDSENWLKASVEYENDQIQRLGCVVTNHGYSDWSSADVDASIKSVWFRLSRNTSRASRERFSFCSSMPFDKAQYGRHVLPPPVLYHRKAAVGAGPAIRFRSASGTLHGQILLC